MNILETLFQNTLLNQVFGNPSFAGVGIVGFFMAIVFLAPTHPVIKVMAFFGGVILALPFLGWGMLLLSFGLGLIIFFALRRMFG